jgi:long-chain acyl-CoA synthetase
MIYVHSMGRAMQYYPEDLAFAGERMRLSFRDLDTRVKRIAGELARNGFRRGDRLALLLPNEPEYIELVYACSYLGVIAVPMNTRYSAVEIEMVLADATPRGLVRHSSLPTPGHSIEWQKVLDQDPFAEMGETPVEAIYDPEAILALIYTSGTTGRPKGVMLTHANVFANVHNFNYWMRYREHGSYLHAAPIFHIADFPAMFAAPVFGAAQSTLPRFQPQSFCEAVEREKITHTGLVPTMINLLTQFPEIAKYNLDSLELLSYGGSPIAPALVGKVREVLPRVKLLQVYGLSETGFLTGLQDGEHTPERLLSCGRPCPGIELRVVDDGGKQVETGKLGEFVVRGSSIMQGYWNNQDETAAAFRNGVFHTGDLGYQHTNGDFYIVDRAKDMIVTGGENVYSGEVEAIIYELPQVREAAVFGIPDPQWGELVAVCVVLKPGAALSAEDLIQHCRKFLAGYKVPRHIEFDENELPKSGSGKILKRNLRDKFWTAQSRRVS